MTIPYQRANHGEGPALHGGGARKWDMKEALLSRAKVTGAPSAKGRATKVLHWSLLSVRLNLDCFEVVILKIHDGNLLSGGMNE